MTLVSAFVLLFMVIDPFGNIPFFVAALPRETLWRLREFRFTVVEKIERENTEQAEEVI